MKKWAKQTGFTIVELLIVIVVIGILAAIVIVAYNGVQTRATNGSKISELKAWQKIFETYRAQVGNYPAMADGGYCLGDNFPSGSGGGGVPRCRDWNYSGSSGYLQSTNTSLLTELAQVATLPTSTKQPVNGTVGPYADYTATAIVLTTVIKGSATECPSGTLYAWDDAAGRLLCKVVLTR